MKVDNITTTGIVDKAGMVNTYRVKAHAYNRSTRADEPVAVFITIDWERLAAMLGTSCLRNKTGKARIGGGIITAKVSA